MKGLWQFLGSDAGPLAILMVAFLGLGYCTHRSDVSAREHRRAQCKQLSELKLTDEARSKLAEQVCR